MTINPADCDRTTVYTGECRDCGTTSDLDTMHAIKASTPSGRAVICDPCHVAEVDRLRAFNLANKAKGGALR